MNIAVVGLGKMGLAIAQRWLRAGYEVHGFDTTAQSRALAADARVTVVEELLAVASCDLIWLMLPAGKVVDEVIASLQPHLRKGTILIEGGNSHFADSVKRYALLQSQGIHFLDCGTSGGLHGADMGYSLMVGGDEAVFNKVRPFLLPLAADHGLAYVGPAGAGHYVKMVHNGIEYALLQAYAEGFHLLKEGSYKDLDLAAIAKVWDHGSIIRSWVLTLYGQVLAADQKLEHISGAIGENQTGRWAFEEAQTHNVPAPLLKESLAIRSWSRETGGNFATKLVAMLRLQFGGHAIKPR